MAKKPRLAQGKRVNTDDQPTRGPKLRAPGTATVVVEHGDVTKAVGRGIKGVSKFVLVSLAVIVLLYVALASSLMAAIPSGTGLTWVARGTFIGGVPDKGDFIYASGAGAIEDSALGRLAEGFVGVDEGMTLEVVAGPFASVSLVDGVIFADNAQTEYANSKVDTQTLNKEYLAICIEGECTHGEALIVPQKAIVGESKGKLSLDGIGPFDSVAVDVSGK